MSKIRLNISGLGIINGLGFNREQYWSALLQGTSAIGRIQGFDASGLRSDRGSQIRGFEPKAWMPPRFYRRLSRLSRLSVAASIEAVLDGAIAVSDENRHRAGCVFGTAFGSTDQTDAFFVSLLEHGPDGAEPFLFPDTVPNALASHVAIFHQLQGPNSTLCQNHLSGENALAYAQSLLEAGHADVVLVGGGDELSPILMHSLNALRALKVLAPSVDPIERFCTDPSARGFIPGEGATCLILERREEDSNRKVKSYGTLEGLAIAGSRSRQLHYEPDGDGLAAAISGALEAALLKPDAIDIIGSPVNGVGELDRIEATALERVFGPRWAAIPRVPSRYFTGEFGSAGLLATATLLMALREGVVPPHVCGPTGRGHPASTRSIAPSVKARLRHALVVGATFGGGGGCLVLSGSHGG
ncbi:MAG: beta-ketoacyl synthase [Syntrophobacteraceae bacterium]